MPRFASKLSERTEVARDTLAFALERPAGFDFTAGQYLTITLPDPPHTDAKGNTRTFSIASPPQETGYLLVATRLTGSAFKRSLAELAFGTPVSIFGPAGSFTLPSDTAIPFVFIAGGIGITPFRSMVFDAVNRQLSCQITLMCSNRMPEDAPFHEELGYIAATYRGLRYLPTMTEAENSRQPWHGERRYISAALLHDCIEDITRPTIYVAGPPGLVAGVTKAVLEAGADPTHVRSEEFAGYESGQVKAGHAQGQVTAGFIRVAKREDLAPGQAKAVEVNSKRIALFNVGGDYYAIADECPHRGGLLSEGELAGKEVTCPLHGAVFDVTTGVVVEPPADEGVASYNVRVSGSDVEVEF